MKSRLIASTLAGLALAAASAFAAPPVELELATERGVQITAPQQWLQLLTSIGINQVRIRGIQAGDEPRATNDGTAQQPNYHVVGILTSHDQLRLPGGTFTRGERAKLKDFFERLLADGAQSLTAPRGQFGLTEKELTAVFADLSQTIDFETKGLQPRAALDRLQTKLALKLDIDAAAGPSLRDAKPVDDELKGITAGTGLAMLLRNYGLAMRPEKARGQAVTYRIVAGDAESISQSTLGNATSPDPKQKDWPIGWDPDKPPGEIAPSLRESRNAEIDGYSLEEALAAISPRLKLRLYVDHAALVAHKIDPAKTQLKLARARMSYKRLLDRVLAQARLGDSIRADENGTLFLWVTR